LLYRNGIAVTSVRNVFISHMHLDHVGGLPQLVHAIRLLSRKVDRSRALPWAMTVDAGWHTGALTFPLVPGATEPDTTLPSAIRLHLPAAGIEPTQRFFAAGGLTPDRLRFALDWRAIAPGPLEALEMVGPVGAAGDLHVTAVPSTHIPGESFAFVVEVRAGTGERKVIYSGDLGHLDDLLPAIDGTDLLLLECSHHHPENIAAFLRRTRPAQTVLVHVHPGLEERVHALADELGEHGVRVAHEGMRIPI
jgi:ribonuclease BN (tRNA processing enzyme)